MRMPSCSKRFQIDVQTDLSNFPEVIISAQTSIHTEIEPADVELRGRIRGESH